MNPETELKISMIVGSIVDGTTHPLTAKIDLMKLFDESPELKGKEDGWIKVEDRMPKSEERVFVVFNGYKDKPFRTLAFYVPQFFKDCEEEEFEGMLDINEVDGKEYWPEGWYETMYEHEETWRLSKKVTHWQPLPQPPTGK